MTAAGRPGATDILSAFAALAGLGIFGNIWILAQEARRRSRTGRWNTRVLRLLTTACGVVVVATALFARPWYWDLALVAVACVALLGVWTLTGWLWRHPDLGVGSAILTSAAAMGLGVVLLTLGGVAAVLDGAALSSPTPILSYHGGRVIAHPVLYQIFWGAQWAQADVTAVHQAVAFQYGVDSSSWGRAVLSAGYGVDEFTPGGCWVDSTPVPLPLTVTTTRTGPFPNEIRAVFTGRHSVSPCPGSGMPAPGSGLNPDSVVALWLPPEAKDEIGGIAEHGTAPWPGLPGGVVVAGLPGAYAFFGMPSCSRNPACSRIPTYAAPSYALSHEVLEAITNPQGTGWFADAPLSWTAHYVLANGPPTLLGFGTRPGYSGEVADLCQPGALPTGRRPPLGRRVTPAGVAVPVAPFYLSDGRCTAG